MTSGLNEAIPRYLRIALYIMLCMIAVSVISRGITQEVFQRIWRDFFDGPSGPVSFRFILQPTMAAIAAIHDGLKDARTGRSPYFWTVLFKPAERSARLTEGLTSTARIILLGLGMDAIYQYEAFGQFYPAEALIIALLLAFVPYVLIRGPAARVARWLGVRAASEQASGPNE